MRYHLLAKGRVVASADVAAGNSPEDYFHLTPQVMIVSDAEWRRFHHRAALRGLYRPPKSALAQLLEA